jgi:hypothetical protein
MNYLLLLAARYPVARFLILILPLMCGLLQALLERFWPQMLVETRQPAYK